MMRSSQTGLLLWLLAALVIGTSGCGGGGSKIRLVSVSGTVTYDGKPLEEGQLSFVTAGASPVRAYGCVVQKGAYSVKVEPGDMVVHVLAMRDVSGKFVEAADGTKKPETENYIPAKFNSASELKYKVPDSGARNVVFDLKP